jgi:glucose-6-phosphate 1-dehydrogenase
VAVRVPDPCALVIFGASGDLTGRKLVPALYNLAVANALPPGFAVIGFARSEKSSETFRAQMRADLEAHSRTVPIRDDVWESFAPRIHYICAGAHDHAAYEHLGQDLDRLDKEAGTGGNRLYYLATPPSAYPEVITLLGEAGLAQREGGWTRAVIEKPFGTNASSAAELNEVVHAQFREDQVFRIDHYLGKETVQNLFVFRFANGIFEPVWNRRYVDHVQITVAETIGVEHRGAYYEEAGATRDMLQNHLLQLLTLTAMEPPVGFEADALRDEKVKVLHALEHGGQDGIVRGQYATGVVEGEKVPGYREEEGVSKSSTTETFVALRCFVDNWRWAGVPFFLRTGKHLPKRVTEIAIAFKPAPFLPFAQTAVSSLEPNSLIIRVQPDEGITLRFGAKVPEPGEMRIRSVDMDFGYEESFSGDAPDAYERLLLDAMLGDATLFTRADEVARQWQFVEPLLDAKDPPSPYAAGTWGPPDAYELIYPRRWREP